MKDNARPLAIGIIPARYGSTRFPGKPLHKILGKSLIQRTFESASKCKSLLTVIVATDDDRIINHVASFGGNAYMTSPDCMTGTDRLVEWAEYDVMFTSIPIIINIQGDEPCIEPHVIESVIDALANDPLAEMATAVVPLKSEEEALDPSVVKCVLDNQQNTLYFSRALIPAGKTLKFDPSKKYYKHLGIYGYRRDFLLEYSKLKPTPLQLAEDLEQLKVLEHGFRIKAAIVESQSIGVDTPEDITKVEQLLCKQNLYS